MASQLLLHMLVASDERADSFGLCFTGLVALANYRDKAVKKAALLEMNLENVKTYRKALEKSHEEKRQRQ
jgi:hypothetical protein